MSGSAFVPAVPSSNDIDLAVLNVRISGCVEAVKRARIAFLASTIASLAIFITEWNAYLSWYRFFSLKEKIPANEVTGELFKDALHQFVEGRVITVSLLGIRVGVSDMAVLGSVTLLVCSIWLFYSIRRHNHSVGSLLRDTKGLPPSYRRLVYYGVSSSLVFTTVSDYDEVISSLDEVPTKKKARLSRNVVTALFYLPAVVIALTVIADILSLYSLSALFAFPHTPPGFAKLPLDQKVQFVAMEAAAIGLGLPTFFLCRKVVRFEQSTGLVLRAYREIPDRTADSSAVPTPTATPSKAVRAAKIVLKTVVTFAWYVGSLFLAAGRLDWVRGWIWVSSSVVGMTAIGLIVYRRNPEVLEARSKWRRQDTKPFDKIFLALYVPLVLIHPAIAALDACRYRWTAMPVALVSPGLLLLCGALGLIAWALVVNPFAEASVRIQSDREQTAITSGPYRLVRHPMYVGMIVMWVANSLILGSVWALGLSAVLAAMVIWRTAQEDRTLREELSGYQNYAARTRYRLLPGVW